MLASACHTSEPARPPSVLLVSIDTLRPDHLGAYGYERATSPHIDELAHEGVLFESAWAPSSWTLPSHASMLTGVSPYRHGAVSREKAIRTDVPLLGELLKERGFATAGVVGAPFVAARYGFKRGFDSFVEKSRRRGDPEALHGEVLRTIASMPSEPFFVFAHYFDVHAPYAPPAEFDRFRPAGAPRPRRAGRAMRLQKLMDEGKLQLGPADRQQLVDLYDGGILAMDQKLGELVDAVRDRTRGDVVIVLTSDHGEEFLEHGGLMHSRTLYDEVLRVPLVVAGPGLRAGARVDTMVSLLDVAPTVLSLVAPDEEVAFEGRSLRAALERDVPLAPPARPLSLLTLGHDLSLDKRGLRNSVRKLILDLKQGRGEIYDVRNDPAETRNLYPVSQMAAAEMELRSLPIAEAPQIPSLDAQTVKSLRALGYL